MATGPVRIEEAWHFADGHLLTYGKKLRATRLANFHYAVIMRLAITNETIFKCHILRLAITNETVFKCRILRLANFHYAVRRFSKVAQLCGWQLPNELENCQPQNGDIYANAVGIS